MKTGIYKGNELKEKQEQPIQILPCKNPGEYKIRFMDGKILSYVFGSEIDFDI